MYVFLFNYIPLPIPPSSLEIKTPSMNKTVTLINDGEINIPKNQGLREISFEFLLPSVNCYPFAQYNLGMPGLGNYTASALIPLLNAWRELNEPTRFIVARLSPDYKPIYFTNILCLIEDFTYKEDAEELGFDTMCSITLKEYKPYSTKRVKAEAPKEKPGSKKGTVEKTRDTTGKNEPKEIKTGNNETIISGANKTGDPIPDALSENNIRLPESLQRPLSENEFMSELDIDLDTGESNYWGDMLETNGDSIKYSASSGRGIDYSAFNQGRPELGSLADSVMKAPSKTTYARPTPKGGYGGIKTNLEQSKGFYEFITRIPAGSLNGFKLW